MAKVSGRIVLVGAEPVLGGLCGTYVTYLKLHLQAMCAVMY